MRGPEWGPEGTASVSVQVCWGVVDWTPGFPLPEPGPDGTVRRRSPPPGAGETWEVLSVLGGCRTTPPVGVPCEAQAEEPRSELLGEQFAGLLGFVAYRVERLQKKELEAAS